MAKENVILPLDIVKMKVVVIVILEILEIMNIAKINLSMLQM